MKRERGKEDDNDEIYIVLVGFVLIYCLVVIIISYKDILFLEEFLR